MHGWHDCGCISVAAKLQTYSQAAWAGPAGPQGTPWKSWPDLVPSDISIAIAIIAIATAQHALPAQSLDHKRLGHGNGPAQQCAYQDMQQLTWALIGPAAQRWLDKYGRRSPQADLTHVAMTGKTWVGHGRRGLTRVCYLPP